MGAKLSDMPELGDPARVDRSFRPLILVLGLLILGAGVALAPIATKQNPRRDGEYSMLHWFFERRTGWFNAVTKALELVGGPLVTPWLMVVSAVVLFLLRRRMMALLAILIPGMGWFPGHLVKKAFFRERPPHELDPIVIYNDTMSYPSGHTGFATSFTIFWVFALTMWGFKRWWVKLLGVFWIVLMAFSRIYAAAHWPLDVLGGFLLACGASLALWNPATWLWKTSQGWRFFVEPEHRAALEAKHQREEAAELEA